MHQRHDEQRTYKSDLKEKHPCMATSQQCPISVQKTGSTMLGSQGTTKNPKPNQHTQRQTKFGTNLTSSSGNQQGKGTQQSRQEKRRRWAKNHVPKPRPVVQQRGPVREYITACCSAPGKKPRAFQKEIGKDPETGKMKDLVKGLGKWRCSACGKIAKVSPRAPQAAIPVVPVEAP